MDPVTVICLVASALGVADLTVKLGFGLRQLQRTYSEALQHVDDIAQQTSTVELAIREICSLLHAAPDTFPPSFESYLKDSTVAIGRVVRQLQLHVDAVHAEAEQSPSKGKLFHVRHSSTVAGWGSNLSVQMQSLSLLLQVAQLHSNGERKSALERESSRKIFRAASSMSAKIGASSRTPSESRLHPLDIQTFSFDPVLLDTKVYRRACESTWKQEVTRHTVEDNHTTSSNSSNDAIASQLGNSAEKQLFRVEDTPCPRALAAERDTAMSLNGPGQGNAPLRPLPSLSEPSASDGANTSTMGRTMTDSMFATTLSSSSQSQPSSDSRPPTQQDAAVAKSRVLVIVEKIGQKHVELPVRGPNYSNTIRDTILKIRDSVLVSNGRPSATYKSIMVSCTIESSGQAADKFPFTPTFLSAALEMMDDGLYAAIDIRAQFSETTLMEDDPTKSPVPPIRDEDSSEKALSAAGKHAIPHYVLEGNADLPFSHRQLITQGASGTVCKVKICPSFRLPFSPGDNPWFAVKSFSNCTREGFRNELRVLRQFSQDEENSHIIKLRATFEQRLETDTIHHLVFSWAGGGNLREFWEHNDATFRADPTETLQWLTEQCAGVSEGLVRIHEFLNRPPSYSNYDTTHFEYGRHGDIKPENILVFSDTNTLVLADFGISTFHTSKRGKNLKFTKKIPCTPTYRAPECDLAAAGECVGRAYDIWSLGCVFLEFMIWYIHGPHEINRFRQRRRTRVKDGAFFITDTKGAANINPPVADQLTELMKHTQSHSDLLENGALADFLRLVAMSLEIDPEKRPQTEELAKQLKRVSAQANRPNDDIADVGQSQTYESIGRSL